MRITNPGSVPVRYEGDWRCTHCHCGWVLDASDGDKVTIYSPQFEKSGYKMPCPHCGHEVWRDNK